MNSLKGDLRLNGYAHRRDEDEDISVGGIVAGNFQLPCRQASCMDPEGLEVVPLEILIRSTC